MPSAQVIVHQEPRAGRSAYNSNLSSYLGSAAFVTFIGATMTTEPVPSPDIARAACGRSDPEGAYSALRHAPLVRLVGRPGARSARNALDR
jgi:hypothetical protein